MARAYNPYINISVTVTPIIPIDLRVKEVGDRVTISDFSVCTTVDSGDFVSFLERTILQDDVCMVIDTNLKHQNLFIEQDLMIYSFKTDVKYHIHSSAVRRIDDYVK